jgi:hypothetical protein
MRLTIYLLLLASLAYPLPPATSYAPARDDCPAITVSCPDEPVEPGKSVTFTANVNGRLDASAKLKYIWTVAAGTISKGQDTPSITVDISGLTGREAITATVEVEGLPDDCPARASCTASMLIGCVMPFDRYGPIDSEDEMARLDNFAIQLMEEPVTEGCIIAYGGRVAREGEALARAERAKKYLSETRGVARDRITVVDGGFREDVTVELWIVPAGASQPLPSPTVRREEVQFIKEPARTKPARKRIR